MKKNIITDRLILNPLSVNESDFIIELVNTEGWKKNIGKRNIHSRAEAVSYIKKYAFEGNTNIWAVKLKETKTPIGIITLLKRDYLEHKDIGFAFLPEYFNKGYAFEAAYEVMNVITEIKDHDHIQATTVPENTGSVKLLKKLGFKFEKEIISENIKMYVYIFVK